MRQEKKLAGLMKLLGYKKSHINVLMAIMSLPDPFTVSNVIELTNYSRSSVSQILNELYRRKVLERWRIGRKYFYSIREGFLFQSYMNFVNRLENEIKNLNNIFPKRIEKIMGERYG